jgi:hypothetical protein
MTNEFDLRWQELLVKLETDFGKIPDLQTVIFLVGVNVLGQGARKFSKEEKQDLMHIAICELLSLAGYYELNGRDVDGWPHYTLLKPLPAFNLLEQEEVLKGYCLQYFEEIEYIVAEKQV